MKKRHKNIIIAVLIVIIGIMGIGYGAFSQKLSINGLVTFRPYEDKVYVSDVEVKKDVTYAEDDTKKTEVDDFSAGIGNISAGTVGEEIIVSMDLVANFTANKQVASWDIIVANASTTNAISLAKVEIINNNSENISKYISWNNSISNVTTTENFGDAQIIEKASDSATPTTSTFKVTAKTADEQYSGPRLNSNYQLVLHYIEI